MTDSTLDDKMLEEIVAHTRLAAFTYTDGADDLLLDDMPDKEDEK